LQKEFQQQVYKQEQAVLKEDRLTGKLPDIDVDGTAFTIDWRLKELRESKNPSNNIRFKDMDLTKDGKGYVCFYDIIKHTIEHPLADITELPKNLKVLEIPNGSKLDPIAVAIETGRNINDFLAENPIERSLSACLHPLSYSNLPELVRKNSTQIDKEECLSTGRDRGKGLSI
jgi:hypothetical protein